jgi:hypothetical protein
MDICKTISPAELRKPLTQLFELAATKTVALDKRWPTADGAPVVTVRGKYTTREWTQWTQGFQYGNALLAFDLTNDKKLLAIGRDHTLRDMAPHLTDTGVHDHAFNNVSTYGQLRRLMLEGRIPDNDRELQLYELALRVSGAVQASRWTRSPDGGYIYSFNGPHSLFIDTMRTLRVCALAHVLGQELGGEQNQKINLLARLLQHAATTARYNVYYGGGRDMYDTREQRGRVAHEAIFNPVSGTYRCPSSQQGYSPFSTWTRGLAWAMLGFAEELEFLRSLSEKDFEACGTTKARELALMEKAALVTCDFYIDQGTASDGLCYWDTGAPYLHKLGDWRRMPADPYNQYEPVDASASAIPAQGLIRLGASLGTRGKQYLLAGLTVSRRLLEEPYLSRDRKHEGLLLHCIYHRPNGWDYIPKGSSVPAGESCMWGDYHLLELGLLIWRMAEKKCYTFF